MTRGRKAHINPSRSLHLHLSADLVKAIDARLWSDAEGKVPKGAYQEFFTEAAVRMMRQLPLDLAPFAGTLPSEHVVYAFAGTREVLQSLLQGNQSHDTRDAIEDRGMEG